MNTEDLKTAILKALGNDCLSITQIFRAVQRHVGGKRVPGRTLDAVKIALVLMEGTGEVLRDGRNRWQRRVPAMTAMELLPGPTFAKPGGARGFDDTRPTMSHAGAAKNIRDTGDRKRDPDHADNELIEEVKIPGWLQPAFMADRPELITMAAPETLDAADTALVLNALRVVMATNQSLRKRMALMRTETADLTGMLDEMAAEGCSITNRANAARRIIMQAVETPAERTAREQREKIRKQPWSERNP